MLKGLNFTNAILIGVQKAGTTSIYDWIAQHPEVCSPYYLKDIPIFYENELYEKIEKILKDSLRKCKGEKVFLTGYVGYLYKAQISAKRIYEYDKNAKLILILRNPIERLKSAYKYAVERGLEKRDINTALIEELKGECKYEPFLDTQLNYIKQSLYSENLKIFLKFFDKNQIFIGTFEEMIRNKEGFMKNLFNFLEVNPNFIPKFTYNHQTLGGYKFEIINKIVNNRYYYPNNKFLKFIKKYIPLEWKSYIIKKLAEFNKKYMYVDTKIKPEILTELKKIFESDIRELENLIDKRLMW